MRPNPEIALAIKAAIESVYPEEMCGVVVVENEKTRFRQMQNRAQHKLNAFEIAPRDLLPVVQKEHAIVHSHPSGNEDFSKRDLRSLRGVKNAWVVTLIDDKLVINTRALKTLIIDEEAAVTQDVESDVTETHRYIVVFSGGRARVTIDDACPGAEHTRG